MNEQTESQAINEVNTVNQVTDDAARSQVAARDAKAFTAKNLNAAFKKISALRKSFRGACRDMMEVAKGDETMRRVCAFLGITAAALSREKIGALHHHIADRYAFYVASAEGDIRRPAKLIKISDESGLVGYIARPAGYLEAIKRIAKAFDGTGRISYEQRGICPPVVEIGEDGVKRVKSLVIYTAAGVPLATTDDHIDRYERFLNGNIRRLK